VHRRGARDRDPKGARNLEDTKGPLRRKLVLSTVGFRRTTYSRCVDGDVAIESLCCR
jgi:hypothetical protein